jgi:hypothetical protein
MIARRDHRGIGIGATGIDADEQAMNGRRRLTTLDGTVNSEALDVWKEFRKARLSRGDGVIVGNYAPHIVAPICQGTYSLSP